MKVSYYPGCSLKTKGFGLEDSAVASMKVLGIRMEEIQRWNCCGTVYSLADDDLVHYLAPVRNLIRARDLGNTKLATLCSYCFNTLKRANNLMKQDAVKRKTLNDFLEDESDYFGEVDVVHVLELLRDEVGWDNLATQIIKPLRNLRIASYYGCTLTRPADIAIDDVEKPVLMKRLIETIGAKSVDFPFETECCGSFQVVAGKASVVNQAGEILNSAQRRGADAMVLTCPLCYFNLGQAQQELKKSKGIPEIPLFYFSQLLALALGLDKEVCHFELSYGDPATLLRNKNLL